MGFNPFKIIKGVGKFAVGAVRKVAPIAAGLVPGGASALGVVNAVASEVGGRKGARQNTRLTGITAGPITSDPRLQFVSTTSGPSSRIGTQQTQVFQSPLDKIRADLERTIRGVAEGFGRDVARGAARGAESEGGIPVAVGANLPLILGVSAVGIAAVIGIVVAVRSS